MAIMKTRVGGVWVNSTKRGAVRFGGTTIPFGPAAGNTPVSLFTTQTPAGTFEDGLAMSLGTIFAFSVPGTITHVRWYVPSNPPTGTVYAAIFGMDETRLTALPDATFGTLTGAAWNTVALATPLVIPTAGERVVAIKTPNRYGASTTGTNPVSPFPLSNGPLSAALGAGRFTTFGAASSQVEFPSSGFNNGCYFIDVIFVPA
jgi:hypothetical protein